MDAPCAPFDHIVTPKQPVEVSVISSLTHMLVLLATIKGGWPEVFTLIVTVFDRSLSQAFTAQVAK